MIDSYASGLFDGEGWVRISRVQPKRTSTHIRYQVLLGINMCYRPVIEDLFRTYGGSLCIPERPSSNPKNRNQFGWRMGSQMAATFMRKIRPFSIVKAKEIDVALELQRNIDENPYHPGKIQPNRQELLDYREILCKEIRSLKKINFELHPFVLSDPIDN